MKSRTNYFYKVTKNGKVIDMCRTHSIKRFSRSLRTIKWQNIPIKVYLRVNYGKNEHNSNNYLNFYNDGEYHTRQDLLTAYEAFVE
jgi:hypothetical protein